MGQYMKIFSGLIAAVFLTVLCIQAPVFAKSVSSNPDQSGKQRYIVVLEDLPLSAYDGRNLQTPSRQKNTVRLQATANRFTGARKLDVNSDRSQQYLRFLDDKLEAIGGEASLRLGRQLKVKRRYRIAMNGFATELDAAEVDALRDMPGISAVHFDKVLRLETDSGPNWIGAGIIHDGDAGVPASGGEGIVIGLIDSGINWDHPSFEDPGEGLPSGSGPWDHVNPYGTQLGLCSDPGVLCNDKLVGVYDFVEDDPNTDVVEEYNKGKDNAGHGSHVASIAAGNPFNDTLKDVPVLISGVAPNANIVSYRVCFVGDLADPNDDGCMTSAVLDAIEQAMIDGVDVINYSIGSEAYNPWNQGLTAFEFLNARAAGIFVVTSAGNAGPNAGSIGAPANAPWITSVGDATHDRVFANILENLSGGDTTPPPDLVGTSFTDGLGITDIVHAADYGFPLCGTGTSEAQSDCAGNTGASNPFGAGTFDGKIVVCDRGEYGRVEKGKNVMLAGAVGYVLANTQEWGEDVVADDHCLPATHLGYEDSEKLRPWLASGVGHQASISGFSKFNIPEAGDRLSDTSSRGPNLPPPDNILKPDLIAPGTDIIGASSVGDNLASLNGTSMASPHIAGGAALIKSVHTDWTPPMLASAITMTATPELAVDFDGTPATPHERGAGRPRLDLAVNAGLYLDETKAGFIAANPGTGGEPKDLNLPGLVDTACRGSCNFHRTVTDLVGGASWVASAHGFTEGVSVSVTPSDFTLADGGSQALTFNIDLRPAEVVGTWVYGEIHLSSSGRPDMVFPVAVYDNGGQLPVEWRINSDSVSGWKDFALSGLAQMPDGTFTSGGLTEPTLTDDRLPQDPTDDNPYDNSAGRMVVWHTVPEDTLLLHTETLPSTATDLDLFVGRDSNGNGIAEEDEELCSSTTPTDEELCDLFTPVAGEYWVIVQNWLATNIRDEVTLESAVIGKQTLSQLTATGSGIVEELGAQTVRLSWDNVSAVPGTELMGAVGLGTHRETPNNIGVIPVKFTKTAVAAPQTLALMPGVSRGLTLSGATTHNLIYIDVPDKTTELTVTASGADGGQSDNLALELYRVEFDNAFADAPFASAPDTSGDPLASATGSGGNGPSAFVSNPLGSPAYIGSGRWYVVLTNNGQDSADIEIRADLVSNGSTDPVQFGIWEPISRVDIHQGIDFNSTGDYRALLWYTYDENGQPAWYLAADPVMDGNVWVARLTRYTNDGLLQQETDVGWVSVTILAEDDIIFSWVLFGEEGSDRMRPLASPDCPIVDGSKKGYDGIWSRPNIGVGGASALVNAVAQAYVNYLYDDSGRPVWWTASANDPDIPTAIDMPILQWTGFCPTCTGPDPTNETIGVLTRAFVDEQNMTWSMDYMLSPPLSGTVTRTDQAEKLTIDKVCR